MKIAFFVTSLNSGGIENYLLRFLQFVNNKISATVYCKSGFLGELEKEYLEVNATLKPFKLGFFSLKDSYRLYKELKYEDYDSIVDFTGNFATIPLLIAKMIGVNKRIVFYRGSSNHFNEDPLRLIYNNFMNKLIPKVSTSIFSNSEAAFDFFFKSQWKNDSRFKVIYNGIDAESFLSTTDNLRKELNIPENAFVIGHLGRYNVAKNHATMIKVAIKLCANDSNIYFLFCGDKVIEELKGEVKKHQLESQIKLLGFRRDVIKVLNTLDCFYFPSITEGQPNALIEAMLAEVPFVTSNIAPIRETVPKELHCQMVNPLNSTSAIKKIMEIKNNVDLFKFQNLSSNVAAIYNSEKLFNEFYEKL